MHGIYVKEILYIYIYMYQDVYYVCEGEYLLCVCVYIYM